MELINCNLKRFPKTAEGENRDEADLWAEGLEKELREILCKDWFDNMELDWRMRILIEAILGGT